MTGAGMQASPYGLAESAVPAAISACFLARGQRFSCASRFWAAERDSWGSE